ncbi:ATP-binding protein [Micromonospora sp. NPDC050200]|uniref:ATP-binding protein n=1 Tax=Micromonospora sp. NPDC050200 TaxID=3155664 RepID=UPI0033D25B71
MSGTERPGARAAPVVPNGSIRPMDARCLVEADESSAIVRLSGLLEPTAAARVRDALLARLTERPGPIVVDVALLRSTGVTAARLLAEIRRTVADWPAADLLVLDPAGTVTGADATGLTVCATADEATAALARTPMAALLAADLAPTVGAARQAREMVADGCARWGVPQLTEPGCTAVTEMVNNVVAHARTAMTIRLAPRDSSLHVAVRDHSPRQPAYAGLAPLTSTGGRGLLLIDTVARRWGSTPVPGGKVVWCVLYAEDEAAYQG